jgi:hypothetical protein
MAKALEKVSRNQEEKINNVVNPELSLEEFKDILVNVKIPAGMSYYWVRGNASEFVTSGMFLIEQLDVFVTHMIMNAAMYGKLRRRIPEAFGRIYTEKELLIKGLFAEMHGAEIIVDKRIKNNEIRFASKEFGYVSSVCGMDDFEFSIDHKPNDELCNIVKRLEGKVNCLNSRVNDLECELFNLKNQGE